MGKWNLDILYKGFDTEEYANDYFPSAFGEDGMLCRDYLEKITDAFCPHLLRLGGWVPVEDAGTVNVDSTNLHWQNNPEFIEKISRVGELVDKVKIAGAQIALPAVLVELFGQLHLEVVKHLSRLL